MYDISNQASLNNVPEWKNSFLQKSMVVSPDTFPFMVIGNKSDLGDDRRQVSCEQAMRVVRDLGSDIDLIETSAKDDSNVE